MKISDGIKWPAIAKTPRAPLAATIARLLFTRAIENLPVRVDFPEGKSIGSSSPSVPAFELVHPRAFFSRIGRDTKIGFGESYMAGDWKPGADTDLADLLTPFAARLSILVPKALQRLRFIVDKRIPSMQKNTLEGSRANISSHYDLSNELFAAFLDPTMSYSSAWFDESEPVVSSTKLKEAQLRKIDGVLDYAGVGAGTRLLEIGTGWGALAIRAATRGAHVTTLTLSTEQMDFAVQEIARARLSHLVDVRLQDYREVEGTFDAIVSVEMLEAVGEAYWPIYFASIDRLLAAEGKACIQSITMGHQRVQATNRSFSWIQKYIFPGGIIPSLQSIDETLAAHTTMHITAQRKLGAHYARTLRLWRERFSSQWPHIRQLGFDETFRRMWEFYLAYCEAGFRTGYLDVCQLQIARKTQWN
jgi:cyclopropane-fatty-acyl-phospholipid synthase